MSGWNFAEVWETIAELIPDAPAQVHGDRRYTWREFDERANGVADTLLQAGVVEQDKVAHYLYNCPEYLESMFGIWKAGLRPDQHQLPLRRRRARLPVGQRRRGGRRLPRLVRAASSSASATGWTAVRLWLWVDDGAGPCPAWAVPYEQAATSHARPGRPGRGAASGDHLYMLYTGGTTGMPKGVMWRQDDLFRNVVGAGFDTRVRDGEPNMDIIRERVQGPGTIGLPACPLMHGTGCMTQLIVMAGGGCTVTLESRGLDVDDLLDTIEREKVNTIAIVGDAFGKPILRALDAEPEPLGPVEPLHHHVVGRDVQRADQAGPASSTSRR